MEMDNINGNFYLKWRLLFHLSMLICFILYPLNFFHGYLSWCELKEVDLCRDIAASEIMNPYHVQVLMIS